MTSASTSAPADREQPRPASAWPGPARHGAAPQRPRHAPAPARNASSAGRAGAHPAGLARAAAARRRASRSASAPSPGGRVGPSAAEELARAGAARHPHHLGHRLDHALAGGQPRLVHHHVERAHHLVADGGVRQPHPGHQRERLHPAQRVGRRVGVHGGERAVVAGVERLEHVERLGPAHLAHDDPVRPHAQRVAHELADRDLAAPLQVGRARLEAHHVALAQAQLGGVLDGHDPLRARESRPTARSAWWSCPSRCRRTRAPTPERPRTPPAARPPRRGACRRGPGRAARSPGAGSA